MKLRLLIAYFGNIIDTISTLYLINKGYTEINPIMAKLLKFPWLFALVKIGIMTAIVARLWACRYNTNAQIVSWVAAIIYGAISIYYGIILICRLH